MHGVPCPVIFQLCDNLNFWNCQCIWYAIPLKFCLWILALVLVRISMEKTPGLWLCPADIIYTVDLRCHDTCKIIPAVWDGKKEILFSNGPNRPVCNIQSIHHVHYDTKTASSVQWPSCLVLVKCTAKHFGKTEGHGRLQVPWQCMYQWQLLRQGKIS